VNLRGCEVQRRQFRTRLATRLRLRAGIGRIGQANLFFGNGEGRREGIFLVRPALGVSQARGNALLMHAKIQLLIGLGQSGCVTGFGPVHRWPFGERHAAGLDRCGLPGHMRGSMRGHRLGSPSYGRRGHGRGNLDRIGPCEAHGPLGLLRPHRLRRDGRLGKRQCGLEVAAGADGDRFGQRGMATARSFSPTSVALSSLWCAT
jgi:hypothetical protein